MTLRAKPVVKRGPRRTWDPQDRRNFFINLAFGVVVVAALLILAAAAFFSWYQDNLAPVGRVDGEAITINELRERYEIEDWRLDESLRRISTQAASGRLTEAEANQRRQLITQQRQQLELIALERIIDNRIQAGLAASEGIVVTDADIDARITEEATTPEARRAWVIEVRPAVSDGEFEPTAAQVAEARIAAEAALDDLRAGKAWEEVARAVSTDAATRERGGDLGYIEAEDRTLDPAYIAAIFETEQDGVTEVVEGEDGTFRIGRVTEIQPEAVDDLYVTKIENDGIDPERYRAVVAGDVIRRSLEDRVVADVIQPGPQRRAAEFFIADSGEVPDDAVKTRHILYSPNDDPSAAGTLEEDDPAWAEAETAARAAYERIVEDPTRFDAIARTESDESIARGTAGSGGKLPYFGPDDQVDEDFLAAIMAPGLEPGQLLEPVRSSFGWHVIQIMYRPTDREQMERLRGRLQAGEDIARLARDYSESTSAGSGGDLGWIARSQLDSQEIEDVVFETPVGEVSEILEVEGDGLYLIVVFEEETRAPEGRQLEQLRATAFSEWYTARKAEVSIERDPAFTGGL
jgi:parvulin-like peptidyl-prolyl isomerase